MRFIRAVAVASLAASPAFAQGGGAAATASCTSVAADACQQAVDFFRYMAPQLGTAITGGNTTLAQGGSMGGPRLGFIPKIAVSARLNVVMGGTPTYAPAAQAPGATAPPAAQQIVTKNAMVPMPSVDVALGVFGGIPLGVTKVGGVDVLASAAYLPEITGDDFSLKPDESLSLGYGLRIGLLQESLVAPGVGFSFLARSLPVTSLEATGGGADFTVSKLDLSSTAWRITASKSLLIIGLAAGFGQDKYKVSHSGIAADISGQTATVPATSVPTITRNNVFVDATMNLFVLKIVATGGMVSGGEVLTYNSFDNPANKSRLYGSVGVRFGL